MTQKTLPPLARITDICRPLSVPEYYHASFSSSPHSIEIPREVILVVEGEGSIHAHDVQLALNKTIAVNPGTRLRMSGHGLNCHWQSDGIPTRLRVLEQTEWDGKSNQGAAFIPATALSQSTGPNSELIFTKLANGRVVLVLRALHSVMDGMGTLHLLHEIFRALRHEPLLGTNASFSDTDIMQSRAGKFSRHNNSPAPIAAAQLNSTEPRTKKSVNDVWQRISIPTLRPALLARTALAFAEFSRKESQRAAVIAIPVDLRRHVPGLTTTCNCTSMLHIDITAQDSAEDFKNKLKEKLNAEAETAWMSVFNAIKILPLHWLDYLFSRRNANYAHKNPLETVVISNLGKIKSSALSCPNFLAEKIYGIPVGGNAFCFLFALDNHIEIIIGLPDYRANNGRMAALIALITQRISEP